MTDLVGYGSTEMMFRLPTWPGAYSPGSRPWGIHPTACIGGPPEHPEWMVGDEILSPIIDPSALINSFVTVDGGMTGHPATFVGPRAFLQSKAHIGHNAIVEEAARVCVGAVICGHAVVGAAASVSGNSWVKPFVKVGTGAIIGGGSVVTKDVPAHEVWCGNPARFVKLAWTHPDYQDPPEKDKHILPYPRVDHLPTPEHLMSHGHGAGVAGDFA